LFFPDSPLLDWRISTNHVTSSEEQLLVGLNDNLLSLPQDLTGFAPGEHSLHHIAGPHEEVKALDNGIGINTDFAQMLFPPAFFPTTQSSFLEDTGPHYISALDLPLNSAPAGTLGGSDSPSSVEGYLSSMTATSSISSCSGEPSDPAQALPLYRPVFYRCSLCKRSGLPSLRATTTSRPTAALLAI